MKSKKRRPGRRSVSKDRERSKDLPEATQDGVLSGDITLPDAVEGYGAQRVQLVQRAVKEWKRQLIDLGGRNNLLHFRDLRRGTLDLTGAQPRELGQVLQSKPTKISSLFRDHEARVNALLRCRTIHKKATENFEERGVATLSVACGLATWEHEGRTWKPRAPILLRRALLRPIGAAQNDFELSLLDEMELNPTLLYVLKVNFDCDFDHEELLSRIDGKIDEPWELEEAYKWLADQASRIPGFDVAPRLVLANFSYAKLPMVNDLEGAFDQLVGHDIIAAIAGDEDARERVRSAAPDPSAVPHPDLTPMADEFLALDADSSQNYAINAVIAGESLIIRGPPGTGKSQTIANLIGSLMARGKKVLFVAEKRAAIDAVLKRLHQRKLGDLVLDFQGGVSSRRAFARTISQALAASKTVPRVDNSAKLRRVERRRTELNSYVAALHDQREPWGISIYDARLELRGLDGVQTATRFRGEVLIGLDGEKEREVEEELADYVGLGGLTLNSSLSPWVSSGIVRSDEVPKAYALVADLLQRQLPASIDFLEQVCAEVALPSAPLLNEWEPRLDLLDDIRKTLEFFRPTIYEEDLEVLSGRLAPAAIGGFARLWASMFSADYKQAREEARRLRVGDDKIPDLELYVHCRTALDELKRWRSLGSKRAPALPLRAAELRPLFNQLRDRIVDIGVLIKMDGILSLPVTEVEQLLQRLVDDRPILAKLPDLHRLDTSLLGAGLEDFLSELGEGRVSEEVGIRMFRRAWLESILESVSLADSVIGGFVPENHQRAVEDFKAGDAIHIQDTAARILRICAEEATKRREEFKGQDQLVRHQAGLKSRHLPVRELVREASDVLLALKPCWAMSPLIVSQLLPPTTNFDVVIFDEASQITPADAAASILRGKQLVVAGDERQLPPTAFFLTDTPEDEEGDEERDEEFELLARLGPKGFESILDVLGTIFGFPRTLRWHYRSRDERLIAFSNAHIYDGMLTTFPGIGVDPILKQVLARWEPGAETNSPWPEVETVVDLILEHARIRPDESLGVVGMGIKHANRIDMHLHERLSHDPGLAEELAEFFDEAREERFFIKNLERVQGDERDAIILSIGYGKSAHGNLPYRFGPLLTDGGERRLNVAVTRAKQRMTLVSSFNSTDMDPDRSDRAGVKLLRHYLQYMESNGTNLGERVAERPALNPFEIDVRDTLSSRGLKLTSQHGSSGYWIDFVAHHPTQPGRYVLAIEADGATYHSSETARDRDRLRQEQLERLGWRFHRIWSTEWFQDKAAAVEKVLKAYEDAVRVAKMESSKPAAKPDKLSDAPSNDDPADLASLPQANRNGPRPPVKRGLSIRDYPESRLIQLARWIESDDGLRTEGELLTEMMKELGFKRRGPQIVSGIEAAIRKARN